MYDADAFSPARWLLLKKDEAAFVPQALAGLLGGGVSYTLGAQLAANGTQVGPGLCTPKPPPKQGSRPRTAFLTLNPQ